MPSIRVFLADDHAVVREGLKALVASQPDLEVVGEAADGAGACEGVRRTSPDVLLMDIAMPGMNGVRAAEAVRREHPAVKVLILTGYEDKDYLEQLLSVGVVGYVLKREAAEGLIRAVRVVAGGGIYLDPNMAGKLVSKVVRRSTGEMAAGRDDLSDRETDVVRLTAAGYSNKEIAARLDLSVKTIETYRARASEKLGLCGRAELVRYAVRRGWLQEG